MLDARGSASSGSSSPWRCCSARSWPDPQQDEDAWDHASRLVHTYGTDTLAYFALRDDKSFFFSSDGEAMIAYTYIGRYALASGDPIGRPESIELVVDEFLAMCRQRAWGVAFLAVLESTATATSTGGCTPSTWATRRSCDCTRLQPQGQEVEEHPPVRRSGSSAPTGSSMLAETDASPELIHELNDLSAKWRGKAPERGFTMTPEPATSTASNPEFRLCVALDEDGKPGGFLRIVPVLRRRARLHARPHAPRPGHARTA